MNEKFFQLPIEKQQRMINAAYKVFAQNSYKKAPMSEIAKEGDISKALLFHYFTNKSELYLFLWDRAIEQIHKTSSEYHVLETTDFFEMLHRSLQAKCSVMRSQPYLYLFTMNAYYEQDQNIKYSIREKFDFANKSSEDVIWELVDTSKLRADIDSKLLYQEIVWLADGYMRQMFMEGALDTQQMEQDFERMIKQWKKVYLTD